MSAARRALSSAGAVACALSVALGAYASHAADGQAAQRLGLAALFGFGHGLALLLLAPRLHGRLGAASLAVLALGLLLFAGSLAAAGLAGTATTLAPAGGLLLIAGWLGVAAGVARRDPP